MTNLMLIAQLRDDLRSDREALSDVFHRVALFPTLKEAVAEALSLKRRIRELERCLRLAGHNI